jgi:hypothetical protein
VRACGFTGWRRVDPQVVALRGCHDRRLAVANERPARRARVVTPTRRVLRRATSGARSRRVSRRNAPNGTPSGRAAPEKACGAIGWRRAPLRSWPLEPAHSTGWRHPAASRQDVLLRIRLTRRIDGRGHAGRLRMAIRPPLSPRQEFRTRMGRHLTIRWSRRGDQRAYAVPGPALVAPQLKLRRYAVTNHTD